jgi:hypothetical protein
MIAQFLIITLFLSIIFLIVSYTFRPGHIHRYHHRHEHFIDSAPSSPSLASQVTVPVADTQQDALIIFHMTNCYHSQMALPIWYQLLEQVPATLEIKEYDCTQDKEYADMYNVSKYPTVILVRNGTRTVFDMEFSLRNLVTFLRSHNIYIAAPLERFKDDGDGDGDGNADDGEIVKGGDNICPAVTFDSYTSDDNKSHYQIFSAKGQYGYSTGGDGESLSRYEAAYNEIDSYLTSIPDPTPEKMAQCAKKYGSNIREFGLCNESEIKKMRADMKSVANGHSKFHRNISMADYSNKPLVISAIENACNLSS